MAKLTPEEPCVQFVCGNERFDSHHQCSRRGVITEGRKLWCKFHAPSAVKARDKKWMKDFKAESNRINAKHKRREAEQSACACLNTKALESGLLGEFVRSIAEINMNSCNWIPPDDLEKLILKARELLKKGADNAKED